MNKKIIRVDRVCKHPYCDNVFNVKEKDTKMYCCKKCSNTSPIEIKIRNEHAKQTIIEKYNGVHYSNLPSVQEKHYSTMLKNHGVKHAMELENNKQKLRDAIQTQGGTKNHAQKSLASRIKHYGSTIIPTESYINVRNKIYDKIMSWKHVTPMFTKEEILEHGVSNGHKYLFKCNTCQCERLYRLGGGNIPACKACAMRKIATTSKSEMEVLQFINDQLPNTSIQSRVRNLLINNHEIDIYIPEYKLAIEYNGFIWHSEIFGGKDRKYHLHKTQQCAIKGIELLHITDYHWHIKQDVVKSIILYKLGIITNIKHDNLHISHISTHRKNEFLEHNDINGKCNSNYNIALLDNNNQIKAMLAIHSRKNKSGKYYEITRYTSANYLSIPDGFKILLEYFINEIYPSKIITYIDRNIGVDKIYPACGFSCINTLKPEYQYVHGNQFNLFNIETFAKHKLKLKLKKFNPELSSWENMKLNGYDRLWNCGYFVYQLIPQY